jgi:proteasome regulatory subunit
MDGFEDRGDIRIIAATNRFDMLDRAILRPGRFDRLIEVPEPDHEGRVEILKIHTRQMSVDDDVDYDGLSKLTEGYNGADIASVATEAGMFAIRDDRTTVRMGDFEEAIEKIESDGAADTAASVERDYAY